MFALATFVSALISCAVTDDTFRDAPMVNHAEDGARGATVAAWDGTTSVFALDTSLGQVSQLDLQTGDSLHVTLGGEPTRLLVQDQRLFVTLRGSDELVVLALTDSLAAAPAELSRHPTAVEPYGLAADSERRRLYIASSREGVIEERDLDTLEVLRVHAVGPEPRWLAIHPTGQWLYVGHAVGPHLTAVSLSDGDQLLVDPPEVLSEMRSAAQPYTPRVTGDLSVSPDGRRLAVPILYVDHFASESTEVGLSQGTSVEGYYTEGVLDTTPGQGRFQPAVTLFELDEDGEPDPGSGLPLSTIEETRVDNDAVVARSYLSSVSWSPDQSAIAGPMEASDTVLWVSVPAALPSWSPGEPLLAADATTLETGAGPAMVVWTGHFLALIHENLDRAVTVLTTDQTSGNVLTREESWWPFEGDLGWEFELGRRLFTSAVDDSLVDTSVGVSCSTCHFEGRTDGLTWEFDDGDRQTPSLGGVVSETAPVTWTEGVQSVALEAQLTARLRMGGARGAVNPALFDAIAVFVDATPNESGVPQDPDAVARGAEVFFRDDVACGECHVPPLYTDNRGHALYGLDDVMTPSLVGVAATAPYLHDGSEPTLQALLLRSQDGSMGDTSGLSEGELADLEAFLMTL